MFYIAICDDDPYESGQINQYLQDLTKFGLNAEIVIYHNGQELIDAHARKRRFHLILLDMIMEPLNGIETAIQVRQFDPHVPLLIITATSEYAVDGYKVNALRYLLKPVNKDDLLSFVVPLLRGREEREKSYFSFSTPTGALRIQTDDIYYFESNLRKIRVVSKDDCYIFTGKISEIEQALSGQDFVRIHKSFVVNLHYANSLNATELSLDNGEKLPVSKHRYREIMLRFMDMSINEGV